MKTLNNRLTILIAALLLSFSLSAQAQPGRGGGGNRQDRVARVESARIAFITDRLALTPQQAEKFWPVYNQYTGEVRTLRKQNRDQRGGQPNIDGKGDDQARQQLDDELDQQQAMLDLRRRYNAAFLKVISAAQVASLYEAERDFRKQLQQRMQERRQGGGGGRGKMRK